MRIRVGFEDLQRTGTRLLSEAGEFNACYDRMHISLKQLEGLWQGSDAAAFQSQLESLRPKMSQLYEAICAYGRLLQNSAAAYEQLQAQRTASARLL